MPASFASAEAMTSQSKKRRMVPFTGTPDSSGIRKESVVSVSALYTDGRHTEMPMHSTGSYCRVLAWAFIFRRNFSRFSV